MISGVKRKTNSEVPTTDMTYSNIIFFNVIIHIICDRYLINITYNHFHVQQIHSFTILIALGQILLIFIIYILL